MNWLKFASTLSSNPWSDYYEYDYDIMQYTTNTDTTTEGYQDYYDYDTWHEHHKQYRPTEFEESDSLS